MVAGWLAGWPKGGWAMGDGLAAFAAVQNGVSAHKEWPNPFVDRPLPGACA
ncbi:hypothetical protein PMIN05_006590 [Paraphaeosphaeria minitans]